MDTSDYPYEVISDTTEDELKQTVTYKDFVEDGIDFVIKNVTHNGVKKVSIFRKGDFHRIIKYGYVAKKEVL